MAEAESPLRTHLLKRSSRRIIYSSEDEEMCRPAEIPDIHSGCSKENISSCSWSDTEMGTQQVEEEMVICMTHEHDSLWNTASEDEEVEHNMEPGPGTDSDSSSTSTPGFKRGVHETRDSKHDQLTRQAITNIRTKGMRYRLPRWLRKPRGPSMQLLADSQVLNWPQNDRICVVHHHEGYRIRNWIAAMRAESVRITCGTVVLYLESVQGFSDVPPLKNCLHILCKALWQHNSGVRIFIANLLPRVSSSPLDRPIAEINYMLLQAVRSTNRALGKIHFLSLYEHFTTQKRSRVLTPTHRYFGEKQLTRMGCLVLRECLLREAGLKSYWFSKDDEDDGAQ